MDILCQWTSLFKRLRHDERGDRSSPKAFAIIQRSQSKFLLLQFPKHNQLFFSRITKDFGWEGKAETLSIAFPHFELLWHWSSQKGFLNSIEISSLYQKHFIVNLNSLFISLY